MTTKQISRLVVLAAVVISLVVLLIKLIQGVAGIAGSLFNLILGIVVVIARVVIGEQVTCGLAGAVTDAAGVPFTR